MATSNATPHAPWMDPLRVVLAALAGRGCDPTKRGDGWQARCPAHEDDHPSLAIGTGADGKVLLTCHAGCDLQALTRALDLEPKALFPAKPRPERLQPKPEKTSFQDRVGREVASYDYTDEGGTLLYQVVRFEKTSDDGTKKTFLQRRPDLTKRGGWDWKVAGVRRVLFRLPKVIAAVQASRTIYVVEGEKCALRLVDGGLDATCNSGGAQKWTHAHAEPLRGARVVVLPDNDKPGRAHADLVVATLRGIAADVRVLDLPGLDGPGDDAVDWLDAGRTIAELVALADLAPKPMNTVQATSLARPVIEITVEEHEVVAAAIDALRAEPQVFQRMAKLVHVVQDEGKLQGITRPTGSPRILPLPLPRLREVLTARAEWWKWDGDEKVRAHPPDWAVREVDARASWPGIRVIEGVTEMPVLRADGTVLSEPGYDERTGLLYAPTGETPDVPANPTFADAERARDDIIEAVCDFPFAKPAHRAAWFASLLTPLARFAFSGPSPLFLVDANIRSAGKSKLCDVVAMIVTGRPMPRMRYPDSDEEMGKRITSLALGGDLLVLVDNIGGTFGHPSLDAALTGEGWKDRVLGKTEMTAELPLVATWYGSGNNVILRGDLPRRVAHVRLESPLENPEGREDFRHPDLLAWVRRERPRLLAAALTILRAYYVAGTPKAKLRAWGSYEGWTNVIRQAVVWAGLGDPGDAREELENQADTDKQVLRALIDGWKEVDPNAHGETIGNAIRRMNAAQDRFHSLRELFDSLSGPGRAHDPQRIGKKFRGFRRRVIGGLYLDQDGERGGSAKWVVRSQESETGGIEPF